MPFLRKNAEKLNMRMPIKRRIVVDFKRKDSFQSKTIIKADSFMQSTEDDNEDANSVNTEDENSPDMLDALEHSIEKTVHNLDDDDGSFSTKRHKIPIVSDIFHYINLLIK